MSRKKYTRYTIYPENGEYEHNGTYKVFGENWKFCRGFETSNTLRGAYKWASKMTGKIIIERVIIMPSGKRKFTAYTINPRKMIVYPHRGQRNA